MSNAVQALVPITAMASRPRAGEWVEAEGTKDSLVVCGGHDRATAPMAARVRAALDGATRDVRLDGRSA
ncbi:hypothetical protein GCM10028783_03200 [Modestobacter muralis]